LADDAVNAPPELIVRNNARLDILSCLLDSVGLAVGQISAKTGRSKAEIRYHLRLLLSHELVQLGGEREDGGEQGAPIYVASLEGHEEWVREAIEEHRNTASDGSH